MKESLDISASNSPTVLGAATAISDLHDEEKVVFRAGL
jgi:hypothetical protein